LKASDYYTNYYMRMPKVHVVGLVEAQLALPYPLATHRKTLDAMNTGHPGVSCDLSRDRKPHSHSAMDLQAHRAERIPAYALIDRTNWARL
jgi:hypothetical protein